MEAIPRYEPFIEFPGAGEQVNIHSEIELPPMIPGLYTLGVWMGSGHMHTLDWPKDIVTFEIVESPMGGRTIDFPKHAGFIVAHSRIKDLSYSTTQQKTVL